MNYENRAVRHKRWVENMCDGFVLSRTGQDVSSLLFFTYIPALKGLENNGAVRHKRWVNNGVGLMVMSHTGQNIVLVFFSTHIAALKGWNQKASELEELINQNFNSVV